MAEKQEHTTIGLSKPLVALTTVAIALIYFAVFFKDRGGTEATAAVLHNTRVDGHESRITNVEKNVIKVTGDLNNFKDNVVERFHTTEKLQLALQKDQEAILEGQRELKYQQSRFSELQIQQIKSDAEIHAYLKSIETIEP